MKRFEGYPTSMQARMMPNPQGVYGVQALAAGAQSGRSTGNPRAQGFHGATRYAKRNGNVGGGARGEVITPGMSHYSSMGLFRKP